MSENKMYSEEERGKGKGFTRKRRITGYLVEDLDRWGAGKLAEYYARTTHKVEEEELSDGEITEKNLEDM